MKSCFVSAQGDYIIITAPTTGQKFQFAGTWVMNDMVTSEKQTNKQTAQ